MPRVVCAGHVNWDVTLFVDRLPGPDRESLVAERSEAVGGSAGNTATGLAGLDVDTTLLGSVGEDRRGIRARRHLTDADVDCTYLRRVSPGVTTEKYVLVDGGGEVAVLADRGVNEAFEAAHLPDGALAGADHLHLTGQEPTTAAELARRAREADLSVSFDPGRRLADRNFRPAIERADYLFCNGHEATAVPGDDCLDGGPAVVVTRGRGGAELRRDGETVVHDGFDVETVDTTGAGDAFAAGFLAALLDGAGEGRALAAGNACGAIAARSVGGHTALSWDEVERLLDEPA